MKNNKKRKHKQRKKKMEGLREEAAKTSLSTDDSNDSGMKRTRENKRKKRQATVEDHSHKITKHKRKHSEEGIPRKTKKRKTSLVCEEREEHCQELNQNENLKISKREIEHAACEVKSANEQESMVTEKKSCNEDKHPIHVDGFTKTNNCSQLKEQGKSKEQSYPESYEEYDFICLWRASEELAKRFCLRRGKWTKKEERILRENMDKYLSEHKIDDPNKLIFAYKDKTEEGKKWKELVKSTDFYRELSRGLKRDLDSVYRKVLISYQVNDYVGRYSEYEDKELLRLFAVHGNKWTKIGGLMGRSDLSVIHRYQWIKNAVNTGPWQDSEVKCLQEAVRKLTNTKDGEEVYSGIGWTVVASIVKTRNDMQCRDKWLREICWKDCNLYSTEKMWGQEQDVELIDKIYKSQATEECDIDWLSLTTDFEMARSPAWLSQKIYILKRRYCKCVDFEVTEFEDVIDYLYNVVAIDLQNQIFQQQQDT